MMELNDNAVWYVRAMVMRGIQAIEDNNEKAREYLATDPAPTFRQSVEGMVFYNEQLLREALQYIPAELLPGR